MAVVFRDLPHRQQPIFTRGKRTGTVRLLLEAAEAEHVQAELDAKVRQLPFAKDYGKIVTRLFVAKKCPFDAISLSWLDSHDAPGVSD